MKNYHNKGFSLFEILAAVSIFAIIALGITSTMRATIRLTDRLKSKSETSLTGQALAERLQRDIQQAVNPTIPQFKAVFKLEQVGVGQTLTLTTFDREIRLLTERRTPGVLLVQYRLEQSPNGLFNLIRAAQPFFEDSLIAQAPGELLTDRLVSLEIELYDYANDRWSKSWDNQAAGQINMFPTAARVRIETSDPKLPAQDQKDRSAVYSTAFLVIQEIEKKR